MCVPPVCVYHSKSSFTVGSVNMPANCAIIPIWYREMHYIRLSARALARLLFLHGSVVFVTGSVRMLMCVCCFFSVPSQFNSQETCMRASTMISLLGNFLPARKSHKHQIVWARACVFIRVSRLPHSINSLLSANSHFKWETEQNSFVFFASCAFVYLLNSVSVLCVCVCRVRVYFFL